MKRSTEYMLCSSLLLTYFSFTCWFYSLSIIQHGCPDMALMPFIPLVALLIIHGINTFFVERGVSMPVYIAAQLVMAVVLGYLFFRGTYIAEKGMGSRITASIICAFAAICSGFMATEPPKKVTLTVGFDCCVVTLALLLGLNYAIGIPVYGATAITIIVAAFVTVVTLIKSRIDSDGVSGTTQGDPITGKILIVAVFAAVVIVVALIVVLAKGGIQSFSELCLAAFNLVVSGIKALAAFLYHLLELFMQFIARFFHPTTEYLVADSEQAGSMIPPDEMITDATMPSWIGYVVLGLIIAGIGFVLFKLRREKLTVRRTVRRRVNKGTRQNGFGDYLRDKISKLKALIVFNFNYIRYRNTAPALLVYCQHRSGKNLRRQNGESGEKYLARLSKFTTAESAEALMELSKLVEKSFYSPGPVTVPRNVSSAVRKARFEIK